MTKNSRKLLSPLGRTGEEDGVTRAAAGITEIWPLAETLPKQRERERKREGVRGGLLPPLALRSPSLLQVPLKDCP